MFVKNVKDVFMSVDERDDRAASDLVVTIIMVAGFAITTIAFVNWVSTAALNKAADVADCIEGANAQGGLNGANEAADKCSKANHSKDNSFHNDSFYKKRFKDSN